MGALTALPVDYPAVDFSGQPITAGGAAGAVQAQAQGFYLESGVNTAAYGTVSPNTEPDENGLYSGGASVTLRAEIGGTPGVTFSHWTVGGVKDEGTGNNTTLSVTMDAHKTVQAVFVRTFTVNDPGDTVGSESALTLRYALTNATDGDIITLPAGRTITLTAALPQITRSITIAGNGAAVTAFRVLNIAAAATVKVSRVHFKDCSGGAVTNTGNLTLVNRAENRFKHTCE